MNPLEKKYHCVGCNSEVTEINYAGFERDEDGNPIHADGSPVKDFLCPICGALWAEEVGVE